jgi:hypothetical protein
MSSEEFLIEKHLDYIEVTETGKEWLIKLNKVDYTNDYDC